MLTGKWQPIRWYCNIFPRTQVIDIDYRKIFITVQIFSVASSSLSSPNSSLVSLIKLPTKTIVLTILQLSQQTLMNLKIHKILVLETVQEICHCVLPLHLIMTMVDDEVEFINSSCSSMAMDFYQTKRSNYFILTRSINGALVDSSKKGDLREKLPLQI